MKATAYCPAVIIEAFNQLSGEIIPANDFQRNFFARYQGLNLTPLTDKMWAIAGSAEEINAFMKEHEQDIQVSNAGVAGVLKIALQWQKPGTKVRHEVDGVAYQGAKFDTGYGCPAFIRDIGKEYPVIQILGEEAGWSVYIAEAPDLDIDAADLPAMAQGILDGVIRNIFRQPNYENAILPAASLSTDVDVTPFIGLCKSWLCVDDAVKKVVCEIDHEGARAEAAVAFTKRGMSPPPYVVTQPYLAIFHHEDMGHEAAFTAYMTPDAWVKWSD